MAEIGIKDVYDLTQRLNGKLDVYTQQTSPIVPQPRVQAETVADVAGCYARMAGELGEMVRTEAVRSANASAAISESLRELETALRALVEAAL